MSKIRALTAASAVGAAAALTAQASADFTYSNFNSTEGLTLVGDAIAGPGLAGEDNTLTLTPPGQFSRVGGVWRTEKANVGIGFITDFRFRVRDRGELPSADGIAFVIQNSSLSALGGPGGAIGYATNPIFGGTGISNSLAVVFDSYNNVEPGFVQSGAANVVQVQSRGILPNVPTANANFGVASAADPFADGSIKTVRIAYTQGAGLTIFYQNLASPILTVPIDLSSQLALSGIQSWVGFTSATGGAPQRHEIVDWSFVEIVPSPGAGALLALGGLVAARRRRSA